MDNNERDDVLTDIQVNSAVTREKIEAIEGELQSIKETQSNREERLTKVETQTTQNRVVIAGVGALATAAATGAASEATKWLL